MLKKSLIIFFLILGACAQKEDLTTLNSQQKTCTGFVKSSSGQPSFWAKKFPVQLYISPSLSEKYIHILEDAVSTWNTVLGDDVFNLQSNTLNKKTISWDNKNTVYLTDSANAQNTSTHHRYASTYIATQGESNNIIEADILIFANENFNFSSLNNPKKDQIDLYSILLHELGHALGLEHNDLVHSLMKTHINPGENQRGFAGQDLEQLSCMYSRWLDIEPE